MFGFIILNILRHITATVFSQKLPILSENAFFWQKYGFLAKIMVFNEIIPSKISLILELILETRIWFWKLR